MEELARAKVNLFLHVVGKRPDGYHLLDSLAVFPGAADRVRAEPADGLTLRVEGPFGAGLAGDDNLVLRAARALAKAAGVTTGAALVLDKRLPVASGIGGGSADAAAALRVLARLWAVSLPPAELAGIAAGLGADVPVCLVGEPSRMGGVGEVLGVAPVMPAFGMMLLRPRHAVSTPVVFAARRGPYSDPAVLPAAWADAVAMADSLRDLRNDLEAPAIGLCSDIRTALDLLERQDGCLLARMSGSGATCFGLFADGNAARRAAEQDWPEFWAWGGEVPRGAGATGA